MRTPTKKARSIPLRAFFIHPYYHTASGSSRKDICPSGTSTFFRRERAALTSSNRSPRDCSHCSVVDILYSVPDILGAWTTAVGRAY
ncbi:MAG: hypothetical protein JW934_00185 [Anaerolineae bacterium]|nr:hypothetical protein [Anaerolineae bacterium]